MTNQIAISTLIASFAKANKVSKVKTEALVNEIVSLVEPVQVVKVKKEYQPKTLRSDRRIDVETKIISHIKANGSITVNDAKSMGIKSAPFMLKTMLQSNKIQIAGKVSTGSKGQPAKVFVIA